MYTFSGMFLKNLSWQYRSYLIHASISKRNRLRSWNPKIFQLNELCILDWWPPPFEWVTSIGWNNILKDSTFYALSNAKRMECLSWKVGELIWAWLEIVDSKFNFLDFLYLTGARYRFIIKIVCSFICRKNKSCIFNFDIVVHMSLDER